MLDKNILFHIGVANRMATPALQKKPKVVVIMPAYNAAKTLKLTYKELPRDVVDLVVPMKP